MGTKILEHTLHYRPTDREVVERITKALQEAKIGQIVKHRVWPWGRNVNPTHEGFSFA